MMDITTGDGSDAKLFKRQVRDTSQAVLDYPGRIFPFFAVNPARGNHLKLMKDALKNGGFVGVKLYPSLGYKLDTPEMDAVFAHCAETETPILMHCNEGGFYARKEYIPYGNPRKWRAILAKYSSLRVCFGHFGGDGNITEHPVDDSSWTGTILELMATYPGVYADISYNTAPTKSDENAEAYFANLERWLDSDSPYRDRILFGTDFFLVRMRMRESSYWTYFETKLEETSLGVDAFKQIAEINPAAYLGLPASAPRANIARYIDFVVAYSDCLKRRGWLPRPKQSTARLRN